MGYGVGVDLGTTWTAAAVVRPGGEPQIVALGGRSASIPTVVALQDGAFVVGDAAVRRGVEAPDQLAREFKRRVGDTVPVLVGGQPWSPESLLAAVLTWVLARVAQQEGGPPDDVVVTHPANWGPLRRELLEQAVAATGARARFVTEPEAAAIHYAAAERVPDGAVIAVYDLGGGTFDATVLRKQGDGFAVLGPPGGIERLGGLDIDAAVVGHVTAALGPAWAALDPDDPAARAAAGRLRDDAVAAKEALSEDSDVAVPVHLPGAPPSVRLTRAELEDLVRPLVTSSADALAAAIAGAGLAPGDVDRILLVGGSSRIPLVSQVLAARFDRPLALDTHPKHAVALGAARLARPHVAAAPAGLAATATVPQPAPDHRARIAVGAVVAVAAIVAGFLLLGGGGDDDPGEAGSGEAPAGFERTTTTTTGATTTTPPPALDPTAALLGDAGFVTVIATLSGCDGAEQDCPVGTEEFSTLVETTCEDDACAVSFDGSPPAALEPDADGNLVASGPGRTGAGLRCEDRSDPTTFELALFADGEPATVDELVGSLVFTVEAADTTCGARTRTYAVVLRDVPDPVPPSELAGRWLFEGAASECVGLGDCPRFGTEDGFGAFVTFACDEAEACTAAVASSPAQPLTAGTFPYVAEGDLEGGDAFQCDGGPDPTRWRVEVAAIDGDAWSGTIALSSAAGDIDGNSCVEERVVVPGDATRSD